MNTMQSYLSNYYSLPQFWLHNKKHLQEIEMSNLIAQLMRATAMYLKSGST